MREMFLSSVELRFAEKDSLLDEHEIFQSLSSRVVN